MPYEPDAPDVSDRSRNYALIWMGAASALFVFGNLFIGMDNMLVVLAYGAMAGGLLQSVLGNSTDEYFQSLAGVGHRWAITVLAVFLVILFIVANGEIAYAAGFWLTAGESRTAEKLVRAPFLENAITLSVFVSLAFYAGFTFAFPRDRSSEEE